MTESELSISSGLSKAEPSFPQFPEGTTVERKGDHIYIYDSTRTKRWVLHSFVMDWEHKQHNSLDLQGKAGGTTWHTLMSAYLPKDADTDQIQKAVIIIDGISGPTCHVLDDTPSQEGQYSTSNGGVLHMGAGGGYYGIREDVERDLKEHKAVAITIEEFPPVIDVEKTAQALTEVFREGGFAPPQFVIPKESNPAPSLISKVTEIYHRLRGGQVKEITGLGW